MTSLRGATRRAKGPRGAVFALNKPYGVLSQFTAARGERSLAGFGLPRAARVVGRLDKDSEGLLLLAEDGVWAQRLIDPQAGHARIYWAFVENPPGDAACEALCAGLRLRDGPAQALEARRIAPPSLTPRDPAPQPRPGRETGWVALALAEGRNRQVRRMLAAVDAPVLRLIRSAIGAFSLPELDCAVGAWRALNRKEIEALMRPAALQSRAHARGGLDDQCENASDP